MIVQLFLRLVLGDVHFVLDESSGSQPSGTLPEEHAEGCRFGALTSFGRHFVQWHSKPSRSVLRVDILTRRQLGGQQAVLIQMRGNANFDLPVIGPDDQSSRRGNNALAEFWRLGCRQIL
jgi:hypothetical protein